MNKVELFLQDSSGVDLVDPVRLTEAIPKDGISIDDEKLSGIDNFIIEARRAKIDIKLLKHNLSFNNSLTTLLTDKSRLLSDGMDTIQRQSLLFSTDTVNEKFSDSTIFDRHFNDEDSETWNNEDSGIFAIQSVELLEIIYTMLKHGVGFGDYGQYHNIDGYDQYFIYSARNLFAFLGRGLQIENSLPPTDSTELGTLFVNYLNDIYDGFGDDLVTYIDSEMDRPNFNKMFDVVDRISGTTIYTPRSYLLYIAEWIKLNFETNEMYFELPNGTIIYPTGGDNYSIAAMFLASIIKYEWFSSVRDEYFANNMQPVYMTHFYQRAILVNAVFSKWHYVFLNKASELVLRYKFNQTNASFSSTINNVFLSNIASTKLITCLEEKVNNIKIGKVRTATILNENGEDENGIKIDQNWSESLTELFNPVYRYYTLRNKTDQYYFYLDNINFSQIFASNNNTAFCLAGFTDTNWIYFDKITGHEILLGDNQVTFSDNIPVYDEDSGDENDNFGLYIYRDFFDKYYVKNKSNLMNIYGKVTVGGNTIYRGVVDFNSVSINRNSLSFELIDSIGITVENINKLESFVEFSQFESITGGVVANKLAGSSIGDLINSAIISPCPYSHALNNVSFDIGANPGLEHKVLEEISAETGFIDAIQCSKSLIYVNQNGIPDITGDILTDGNTATIDGDILSIETSQRVSSETFNIDNLKNIAGFNQFVPDIVKFYMQTRNNYSVEKNIEIYGQTSEINLLDRITIDDKTYIVINKGIDLRNKIMKITAIGSA